MARSNAELLKTAHEKVATMHRKYGDPNNVPMTPLELGALRVTYLPDIAEMGYDTFTCDDCCEAHCCPFVYDPYNTGGDCLRSK
jgi:hypothetical protein